MEESKTTSAEETTPGREMSSKSASNGQSTDSVNKNDDKLPKLGNTSGENEAERTCASEEDAKKDKSSDENMADDSSIQSNASESTSRLSAREQDILPVDESTIERLTSCFLQTFLPQAQSSNSILDELMRNQRVLIETLQQENAKFKENKTMSELSELMVEAKRYHSKLVHLKKEMISLHDRSAKLKKRALKLQHHKMKQSLQKEQQREREMEQEKHLIAKPATKKTP